MEVYISSNAFWALLISAIEVYKKECFGLLLGYRDSGNIYIVEHAISYQTANRRHTSVEKNGRASRRMEKFLANLPHLSLERNEQLASHALSSRMRDDVHALYLTRRI